MICICCFVSESLHSSWLRFKVTFVWFGSYYLIKHCSQWNVNVGHFWPVNHEVFQFLSNCKIDNGNILYPPVSHRIHYTDFGDDLTFFWLLVKFLNNYSI